MKTECIDNLELKINNRESILINNDEFDHLYISNIDDLGDEISYAKGNLNNSLYANFFIVKLLNESVESSIIKKLLNEKNIVNISIKFKNGISQSFDIAKKRIAENGILINMYEDIFIDDNKDLCILISDKKFKYKKELFA